MTPGGREPGDVPRPGRTARIAGAVVALLVAGWFGLGVVQEHALGEADALVQERVTLQPGPAARAERLLDRAATLSPDRRPELTLARVQADREDRAAARRTLLQVVDEQPDDLYAWLQLALTVKDVDPALYRRATREARRLNPPVPAG